MMQVHLVQLNIVWEDRAANHARVDALLEHHKVNPGDLIILPEMFDTGFSINTAVTIQDESRFSEAYASKLAARLHASVIAGVVAPSDQSTGPKGSNEAVVFGPDGAEIGRYRKIQPFSLGFEHEHHAAGDTPVCVDWKGLSVAPLICYDLRFPEHFRTAAAMGAELFAVIANWPSMRTDHWVTLLRARAIENQAYVVGVNRSGSDPTLEYDGRSIVVDPHGAIIADAGSAEGVVSAPIDPHVVREWRQKFPALRDRR